MAAKLSTDKQSDFKWVCRSETPNPDNKHFPFRAHIALFRDGRVEESVNKVGVCAPTQELRDYAAKQLIKLQTLENQTSSVPKPVKQRSGACLNCGIVDYILLGRGYCTDCYSEL